MSNHYPEPWSADGATIKALDHGRRFKVASASAPRVTREGQEHNANRIVACVNAMAGVKNPKAIGKLLTEARDAAEDTDLALAVCRAIRDAIA